MSISSEILIILLLVLINGILAMSEAALLASRKARLQQLANEGDQNAASTLDLLKSPNVFLSTIQIGITLIGVLAGAVGGATIAESLSASMINIPYIGAYSESIALGIVVVTITILTIWLGELVPKRLGIHKPERIASVVVGPMLFISRLFSPLVRLMSNGTDLVLTLFGIKPTNEPPITEEELQVLIDQGTRAGVFEEAEQDMVEGVFSLGETRVYSVMTPRTEIVWLDVNDTTEEILEKIGNSPYSRFPVRQDSLETIVGIVKSRDLLVTTLSNRSEERRVERV